MGRLAVRKVIYYGKKYSFVSPYIDDGIVILEGPNERGKSTFMDLIYYGLGGRVPSFNKGDKDAKSKHSEIYNDTDNYVTLEIEIDNKSYGLTRFIGDNEIFIAGDGEDVIETYINRNGCKADDIIFSDWMLAKLHIEVFDIVQGTKSFKINFNDLLRLIYYDQKTEVDKIYKNADNTTFISDSLEIRKAIFEILLGKTYNEYYSTLGEYKIKQKQYDKARILMDGYDEFLNQILTEDLRNTANIRALISECDDMIQRLQAARNIAISEKNNSSETLRLIEEQRQILCELQSNKEESLETRATLQQSINKVLYLVDDVEYELKQIQRIRFVNRKLSLFTPDTCPYCLRKVKRDHGKCICGGDVDEQEYEKFFYTDSEYLNIFKVKKRSIQSLKEFLQIKKGQMEVISSKIKELDMQMKGVKDYIDELSKDIVSEYNSAYVRSLDKKEYELNARIIELKNAEELADKREKLAEDLNQIQSELEGLKNKVNIYLNAAQEDMLSKRKDFSQIYFNLMKIADQKCYSATIGEDYMPDINFSEYRARSASVPKRLMYFLTMLIESIEKEVNYPRFLMIDTPNKEGIDKDNLITDITLLAEADEYAKKNNKNYQIILSTGLDTYPESFKNKVFLSLSDKKYLLDENS